MTAVLTPASTEHVHPGDPIPYRVGDLTITPGAPAVPFRLAPVGFGFMDIDAVRDAIKRLTLFRQADGFLGESHRAELDRIIGQLMAAIGEP